MNNTFEVVLGLGSNQNPLHNLEAGIARLRQDYCVTDVSPWYQSPAMGFSGPDFVNLVVVLNFTRDDGFSVAQLAADLKSIEIDFGRSVHAVKYSSRRLDIDLLMVDNLCGTVDQIELPRSDIWQYAFVLRPLLDIRPDLLCPKAQQPIADYWPAVSDQVVTQISSIS